jgi:hypothetical protein
MFRPLSSSARAFAMVIACLLLTIVPAQAAVTITFWSQEFGENFPHAFVTLRGTPDAGGAPVDVSYGFTARAVSPAILLGSVAGMVDHPKRHYMAISNAHFSLVLTDAQYADILRLAEQWGEEKGDSTYNLNKRNCVHFVAEAMRRVGLSVVEDKKLMKKPRSFTQSIAALNVGRVTVIEKPGKEYWATLPDLTPAEAAVTAAAPATQ